MTVATKIAIWTLTPDGADVAQRIAAQIPATDLWFSNTITVPHQANRFDSLRQAVASNFHAYPAHVFVMSVGIVVRVIAPLIKNKTADPAVVVTDEKGWHVISLLSGHIGGANALTLEIAKKLNADPVITTATDLHGVPAIDVIATQKNLVIENPEAIRHVSMAVIKGHPVFLHDPQNHLGGEFDTVKTSPLKIRATEDFSHNIPAVYVDDATTPLPKNTLVLRPRSLAVGIGCNRNTPFDELKSFVIDTLDRFSLAVKSVACLCSVDLKSDEKGLLDLADDLSLPIRFYSRNDLNAVETIANPSEMVEKHIGVKSVCEASAILGSNMGKLIVPKQKKGNATLAVARIPFTSWASDRETSNICPAGQEKSSKPPKLSPDTRPTSTSSVR